MKCRGLTLVELLIVLAMTAVIVIGLTGSYEAALRFQRDMPAREAERQDEIAFFRTLRQTLEGAYLTSDEADISSYFVATSSAGVSSSPDAITFTTIAYGPNGDFVQSDGDFETLHSEFGPQGGLTEVSLSLSPVGEVPTESQNGLFLRKQRPSDGDPSQGGSEELLNSSVETLAFEFFDGVDWVTTWDTTVGERRLPAAVRMTYRLQGDEFDRTYVVRLPQSDVTTQNPVLTNGVTGAPTNGATATPGGQRP